MSSDSSQPTPRELLRRHPTREARIARIREVEKSLEKMEMEDEHNDPTLIEGHIRLTRGYRQGCGVSLLCLSALSLAMYRGGMFFAERREGYPWAIVLVLVFGVAGLLMFLRGLIYRPDPKIIEAAYEPHRGTPQYRSLVKELDHLARALSHDLRVEDEEE